MTLHAAPLPAQPVAETYTVTHAGIEAWIRRSGNYLSVGSFSGNIALIATDGRGSRLPSQPTHLTAAFPIDGDLDAALHAATSYAIGVCAIVAQHHTAVERINTRNRSAVDALRAEHGAIGDSDSDYSDWFAPR